MPLPTPNTVWPPVALAPAIERMQEHDAWYTGDIDVLASIYSSYTSSTPVEQPDKPRTAGFLGIRARLGEIPFWGTKSRAPQAQNRTVLHIPVASDVAAMKSDMLWAEPPRFGAMLPSTSGLRDAPKQTQARLDLIGNSADAHEELNEAGELTSALGGTYYRVRWNRNTQDHVSVEAVDGDAGLPEYRDGALYAVSFWSSYLSDDGQIVYRHFERHQPGIIQHALYA